MKVIIESVNLNSNSKLIIINDYAFRNCINLKQIQLPKSLEKIDFKKVFENCTEIKIEIEEENEHYKIEDDVVYSKNESGIISYDNRKTESYFSMSNEITSIEKKSFKESKLKSVSFSNELNVISEDLIDIIAQEGHGDGTYRGNVSYNSHGEQLH